MKYDNYTELASAFITGELDKYYYLMLDKGGLENSLTYFNPELSDAENERKAMECHKLFDGDRCIEEIFKAAGIPCEWC